MICHHSFFSFLFLLGLFLRVLVASGAGGQWCWWPVVLEASGAGGQWC
jgi:hypothetical protein